MICLTTVLILLATDQIASTEGKCVDLDEKCTKSPFKPCCGTHVCDLKGLFNGVCVECITQGRVCWRDRDCCSGRCYWLRCQCVNHGAAVGTEQVSDSPTTTEKEEQQTTTSQEGSAPSMDADQTTMSVGREFNSMSMEQALTTISNEITTDS